MGARWKNLNSPSHCIPMDWRTNVRMGITYFNCHNLPTWFVDHFVDRTISASSNFSKVFQVLCCKIPMLLRGNLQFS